MVKHTQTIRRQIADEFFVFVFDHFVGLAPKGLNPAFIKIFARYFFYQQSNYSFFTPYTLELHLNNNGSNNS